LAEALEAVLGGIRSDDRPRVCACLHLFPLEFQLIQFFTSPVILLPMQETFLDKDTRCKFFGYTFKNTMECAPSSYSIPNARLILAKLMLEHVSGPTPLTLLLHCNKIFRVWEGELRDIYSPQK
jgi:hypothetical protein